MEGVSKINGSKYSIQRQAQKFFKKIFYQEREWKGERKEMGEEKKEKEEKEEEKEKTTEGEILISPYYQVS
jgi:hypothetical protein